MVEESEILPNLFVGNSDAGLACSTDKDFFIIDVRDDNICHSVYYTAVAEHMWQSLFPEHDMFSHIISIDNLDFIVDIIEQKMAEGKKVIVHCGAGVERSPLVCTWFMHKKKGMEFKQAYEFVKNKHHDTRDISDWLPFNYFDNYEEAK